jgi:hypothetical protein
MRTPVRCLAAAIAGTALLVVGPGAFATAGATNVLSDKVTFTAQLVPSPAGFTLQNLNCSLTSDGETQAFPCQISGTLMQTSPTTATISTTVTSADGTINSSATITTSSTGSFLGKGRGVEMDAPDIPGTPPPPPYPCVAKYSGTINAAMVMSGTLKIKESSTAP